MDELAEIFADLGFSVAEGPEIETNGTISPRSTCPRFHPARAMQDTFYLEPRDAGRRAARAAHPHVAGADPGDGGARRRRSTSIAPGRVYRSDSDATHTPMFHQVEGLVIDRGITLGHLKWTLETFLKAFFERDDVVLRMRPSAISRSPSRRPKSTSAGRWRRAGAWSAAAKAGWRCWAAAWSTRASSPIAGSIPTNGRASPSAAAIDRLAMLKYGMDDLRAFFDGDIRWLKHYGFRALDVPTLSGGVGA